MNSQKMTRPPSLFNEFLDFLKQETGKEVSPVDAVFHRDFTEHRHTRYPDSEADAWKAEFMTRTWINVALREGLSDEIRSTLFPERFDLGYTSSNDGESAKLADLIAEINSGVSDLQGEKLSGVTKKDLQTTLDGIKNTIAQDLSNSEVDYPATTLKVIKLMYKMTKSRKSHLFGLIKPPRGKPTSEFSENESVIADLIAYLSIEIPEERLKNIHVQLLTSPKLLECIALENEEITAPIRTFHSGDNHRISAAYHELAECIEEYQPERLATTSIPLGETLYIYLRTLEFQHFVGEYEEIVEKSRIEDEINDVRIEIIGLCDFLSEEGKTKIFPNTVVTSINEFPGLVRNHATRFRGIVKSATGLSVRSDKFEEIVSYASRILVMYSWTCFGEKNMDAVVISISDCIAALCAVRHQQVKKTTHQPRVHGQKTPGKSPLRAFAKERTNEELIKTDFIPHGVSQLMHQRFCQIHDHMTGCYQRNKAYSRFNIERLKKYVYCLQSYEIDSIIRSVAQFNCYCKMCTSSILRIDKINQ